MDEITREKFLKIALVVVGAIFFTIYPLIHRLVQHRARRHHGSTGRV